MAGRTSASITAGERRQLHVPLEIASGTDPYELRRLYGDRVLLKGGIDKRALIAGREAIDAEIARLEPLVRDGGYVPHVDHRVPPDVSFDNYFSRALPSPPSVTLSVISANPFCLA